MKQNLGALEVNLSEKEVEEVRRVAEKANAAQGDRYPEALQKVLYADTPLLEV